MRDRRREILDAADALAAATRHDTYRAIGAAILSRLIPGEHVLWMSSSVGTRTVDFGGDPVFSPMTPAVVSVGLTHPGLRSYAAAPQDLSPRRMSDVASTSHWRNTAFYQEVCRPLGLPKQLNVMILRQTPGPTVSWTISRSDHDADFTDDELAIAGALQPLLWMAERLHARQVVDRAAPPNDDRSDPSRRPTPREAQVLTLLAQGQTAAAIARRCGITPRTVRKHLENLYAKLGCSDRLLAVQRARDLGWLTAG